MGRGDEMKMTVRIPGPLTLAEIIIFSLKVSYHAILFLMVYRMWSLTI